MTASDVLRIVSTVAVTQVVCDLLAKRFVYSQPRYINCVAAFERARVKRDKAVAAATAENSKGQQQATSAKSIEKNSKKIQRAHDDYSEAAANVAKRHTLPNLMTAVVFIFLYKILSTEYSGKVVAVLPFEPWAMIRRLSLRGLKFDPDFKLSEQFLKDGARVKTLNQGCSFIFIYILCTMSVKFLVNKAFGLRPPEGADKGVLTMLDDPKSQKVLQSIGVDTDEINDFRKKNF